MANAAAIGYLELNIKGFEQALTAAKRALTVFAAGVAAMKGVEFLKDGVKDAIDFGNAMHHASRSMGQMDPGRFLIISKALENIGMSTEQAGAAMSDVIQNGRKIENIFGGSANYAAALKNAGAQYGAQAEVLTRSASNFAKVFELLQSVGSKLREFFLSMAEQFLKPLQVTLETLQRIDLTRIGAEFGAQFAKAVNVLNGALANNSLGEIISTGFALGAEYLKNAFENLISIAVEVGQVIATTLGAGIVSIKWDNLLLGIANSLGKTMIDVIGFLMKGLSGVLGSIMAQLGHIVDMIPGVSGSADYWEKDAKGMQGSIDSMIASWKGAMLPNAGPKIDIEYTQDVKEVIKQALTNALSNAGKLTGSEKATELLEKLKSLTIKSLEKGESLASAAPGKITGFKDIKADPYHVIADSMAKIGGGGGAMRVGMTVQDKIALYTKRAADLAKQQVDETQALRRDIQSNKHGLILREGSR